MALVAGARLARRRLSGPGPVRGHWTAAGRSRSRREAAEAEAEVPVFQYVGERAARADRVFVWGFSFSGALGVPSFVVPSSGPGPRAGARPRRRIQPVPYRLELDQKISSAACGYGFTLLSSKTVDVTKVWGMGLNKDSQLGFHRSRKDKTRGYEYVLEPSPVSLPLDRPQETRVLQVSCGRAHSLVLTDREGVFSMGNNSYGQCGRKVVENEIYSESHRVHRMQDFDGQVVQVACGQDHSLFLTDKGEVYSCGWGADGQTGLGHYNVTSSPTKLGGDLAGVNIIQVATYGDCCLAVSADGGLFGWGNSEYLQLASVTDSTQVNVPRCLHFSGVGKVRQAACGGTGCAVLNGDDAWGARGRGMWRGPHGDPSQVIHLNLPHLLGRPHPGNHWHSLAEASAWPAPRGSWIVVAEDAACSVTLCPESLNGYLPGGSGQGPSPAAGEACGLSTGRQPLVGRCGPCVSALQVTCDGVWCHIWPEKPVLGKLSLNTVLGRFLLCLSWQSLGLCLAKAMHVPRTEPHLRRGSQAGLGPRFSSKPPCSWPFLAACHTASSLGGR
ncbi:RCC1-like G exchanging factor-like protein isoform X1 [Symphalangus syndactylus]|uniref:RCC1-like G exchanging factor-like protein isoform X1 n=1 Tax=Symphalangus syndactylus TaxID=9590 RepID=UPI0024412176|nr:RCC1-like G exchanging factor-like protein isoform X1 [Symphalangus syndactylus]